jgi:plasmid stabilization system protein ParE
VTVDAIFERVNGEWPVISASWLSLAIVAVVVGGLAWVVVHVLYRKQIADLKKRLELRDDQLANAKAEIEKIERDLESLEGERQARQNLEALLASFREQLAIAQGQLMAVPRPTVSLSRESSRQSKFDELFGQGSAIDGNLTKGEAERLIGALHELADLMKTRVGSVPAHSATQLPSRLDGSNGPSWWLYVSQKGIPNAIELVATYRADVIDFANSLETAITKQPDLEFRLRKIVGNVGLIANLLNVAGGFMRSMERLNDGEKYRPAVLAMALGGPFQIMAQAQIAVEEWMQLFIEQRAPAVHQEAATYL